MKIRNINPYVMGGILGVVILTGLAGLVVYAISRSPTPQTVVVAAPPSPSVAVSPNKPNLGLLNLLWIPALAIAIMIMRKHFKTTSTTATSTEWPWRKTLAWVGGALGTIVLLVVVIWLKPWQPLGKLAQEWGAIGTAWRAGILLVLLAFLFWDRKWQGVMKRVLAVGIVALILPAILSAMGSAWAKNGSDRESKPIHVDVIKVPARGTSGWYTIPNGKNFTITAKGGSARRIFASGRTPVIDSDGPNRLMRNDGEITKVSDGTLCWESLTGKPLEILVSTQGK